MKVRNLSPGKRIAPSSRRGGSNQRFVLPRASPTPEELPNSRALSAANRNRRHDSNAFLQRVDVAIVLKPMEASAATPVRRSGMELDSGAYKFS